MKSYLIGLIFLLCGMCSIQAQSPETIAERVIGHWLELNNHFKTPGDTWGNYTLDLTLEALLIYGHASDQDSYPRMVAEVFEKRGITAGDTIDYRTQPFCSINFTLGTITGNTEWFTGYIHESYRMRQAAVKSREGAIKHHHQDKHRVLLDYMQEYASRLAKTGYLTGDTALFSESENQFLIYETLLRNKSSGLWSQGRGWCSDTTQLARGAWSRGHGWLLRGLVTSLLYLPEEHKRAVLPVLERVSYSLLEVQAGSGMFHILLDHPVKETAPDVSGTGMIAYYMSIAVKNGWLKEHDFKPGILKATNAIKNYVSDLGEIISSSKGPGPLCKPDEYIDYRPDLDEKHGFQGAIYGMLAEMLMSGSLDP